MIKLIFALHRARHLSRDEFKAYWRDHHGPLVKKLAPRLGIVRYVQSDTQIGAGLDLPAKIRGCDTEPYDGFAELWWESVETMMATSTDPTAREGGRLLIEDEKLFLDLPRCALMFVDERTIYDRDLDASGTFNTDEQ
jgi:uncharacterized protein (TIGR02118 family)